MVWPIFWNKESWNPVICWSDWITEHSYYILQRIRDSCNSEHTYHDTAHGNNQACDGKEQLHVSCTASFSADEEHNIIRASFLHLYQNIKAYNFLFNKYIRQQALEVTSLKKQQVDTSVHYVHALVVLYRSTTMSASSYFMRKRVQCKLKSVYNYCNRFITYNLFSTPNSDSQHQLLNEQWMFFFCHIYVASWRQRDLYSFFITRFNS
jgi:hypothetical protein